MPLTIKVKSSDSALLGHREQVAHLVASQPGFEMPTIGLLCFFDDVDWQRLKEKEKIGKANRGIHIPISEDSFWDWEWPDYLKECLFLQNPITLTTECLFDGVIYLHGSTCASDVGLTMTLAHELQHMVQRSTNRLLWAESTLIGNLIGRLFRNGDTSWNWFDIPHERQARIVAKRVAQNLFGVEQVSAYVEERIAKAVNTTDDNDWKFIRELDSSAQYDLANANRLAFRRLNAYRHEFEILLQKVNEDPDFSDIDLNVLLGEHDSDT